MSFLSSACSSAVYHDICGVGQELFLSGLRAYNHGLISFLFCLKRPCGPAPLFALRIPRAFWRLPGTSDSGPWASWCRAPFRLRPAIEKQKLFT